jgi:hypothetical protein
VKRETGRVISRFAFHAAWSLQENRTRTTLRFLSLLLLLYGLWAGWGGGPQTVAIQPSGMGLAKPEVRVSPKL